MTALRAVAAADPDAGLSLPGWIYHDAEWFAAECAKAGIDGVICVDIPSEEDAELGPALRAAGVNLIRLATPTTDAARLPAVMTLPLILFILPVLFVVILGPAACDISDKLMGPGGLGSGGAN